jgi:hypothetical protein
MSEKRRLFEVVEKLAPAACGILLVCGCLPGCIKTKQTLAEPDFSVYQVQPGDLRLIVVQNGAAADGDSYDEIRLQAGPSVTARYDTVQFNVTPLGAFAGGGTSIAVPLSGSGGAQVYIVSRQVGNTTLSVSVGGVTQDTSLNFTVAYPDELLINPDSADLPAMTGVYTIVTASVLRDTGQASPGLSVNFTDSTAVPNGISIGTFLNTSLSDTSGMVSTQYWLQNPGSYSGYVYLIGTVKLPNGNLVRGSNRIYIR